MLSQADSTRPLSLGTVHVGYNRHSDVEPEINHRHGTEMKGPWGQLICAKPRLVINSYQYRTL